MVADPYLAYNFRVKWDGRYVAAVTSVTGLTGTDQAAHESPSEYVAVPAPDQDADVVAMASMTLEHEGWERD